MIVPIVEGHGEVNSVPLLLRARVLPSLGIYNLAVGSSIRQSKGKIVNENSCKHILRLAANYTEGVTCILVLFDADMLCARDYAPFIKAWATEEIGHLPTAVVMARREYEAWFLASLESLRGFRQIAPDAFYESDPESKRDAKGQLSAYLPPKALYSPIADQAAFTARFDLVQAYRRSSSFRKLVKELCRVLEEAGHAPLVPAEWQS